jgi:hypothetical protein
MVGGDVVPRIRSIHPDICDDETVAELSAYAFRTWVLLWTHLDDDGRGIDNPKLWKGKLYPLSDDVTSDRVERDLSELTACGLLIRYEANGRRWITAKPEAWKKYQRPQKPTPSKLPAPPVPLRDTSGSATARSSRGLGVGDGVELEAEGESEGEDGSTASCGPVASILAARAASHVNGSTSSAVSA